MGIMLGNEQKEIKSKQFWLDMGYKLRTLMPHKILGHIRAWVDGVVYVY